MTPTAKAPSAPSASGPTLSQVWPHWAQIAAAFLTGVATAFLAGYAYSCRNGGKPSHLERGIVTAYRIDLNQAKRAELLQLPGVGESLAQRVEDYRQRHGSFQTIDELSRVNGFGPTALERLRPWVRVNSEENSDLSNRRQLPLKEAPSKKTDKLRGQLDVNRASIEDLQLLPGIGPKMSQRIVDQREKAPFKSIDELRRVPGIGPKIMERLRPYVMVAPPAAAVAARSNS